MNKLSSWFKKHFVPHHGNDHKPHFLRHESMFTVFLILAVVEMAFLVQTLVVFQKTDLLGAVLPAVLTSLTNEDRADNGANPLVENSILDIAAQMKADDMAQNGYFSHTSPGGKTPWSWFDKAGYKYSYAGENLAVNFFESSDVAEAWMKSPTHKANIIKKEFTEVGIGVANGKYEGRDTVFVVQLFGTPQTANSKKQTAESIAPSKIVPASTLTANSKKQIAVSFPTETRVLGDETTIAPVVVETIEKTSSVKLFINKIITSPREYSMYIYALIAFLIFLAILLAVFIKSEIRHPAILARGFGMIAIVVFLAYLNLITLHIDTKVPNNILQSNSIKL